MYARADTADTVCNLRKFRAPHFPAQKSLLHSNARGVDYSQPYASYKRKYRIKENIKPSISSVATEQELHILRCQALHGGLVSVYGRINHIRFLLLEQHHARLDRILDTETGDRARASLADTMTTVCALPFGGRIPPGVNNEDFGGLSQVERYTTSLERDEEALDIDVRHEVVDRGLALGGGHGSV